MATIKTNRDFLTLVSNGTINDEVKAFAKEQIAKLDEKNEKRKVSKSALAHKSENEDFKNAILATLADGKVWIAATLADKLGISTQKISALAKQLVDSKQIVASEVKIPNKGKVKGYALPTSEGEGEGE